MKRRSWSFFALLFIQLIFVHCDKDSLSSQSDNRLPDDTEQIVSFAEIATFLPGTRLYLHLNRKGLEIERRAVVFDGLYVLGSERLLLCHTEDGSAVGAGDSGSPLKTADNRTIAALCYGYYGNSTQFEARVIEDMLRNEDGAPMTRGADGGKRTFPLHFANGIRRELLERMWQSYPGWCLPDPSNIQFGSLPSSLAKQQLPAATVRGGSTIAVFDILGEMVQYGAYGSASLLRHDTLYAFGHRYSTRSTPLAAPTFLCEMISFIESSTESFKAPMVTSQSLGAFVMQNNFGIRIELKATPRTFPLLVTVHTAEGIPLSYQHEIANAHSVSLEKYYAGAVAGSLAWNYLRNKYYYEKFKAVIQARIRTELQEYEINGEAEDVAYWIDYAVMNYIFADLWKDIPEAHLLHLELSIELVKI